MRFRALLLLSTLLASTLAQIGLNNTVMWPLANDSEFAFLLEEVLALSNGGGANTGEVLRAASQIVPGDFESWHTEFKFLADKIHTMAARTNSSKFPVSARDAYFRSASYYRAADFFLHGNASDPRINSLWDAQLADFESAIKLLPVPGEKISLQGSGYTIPVYFYPAQNPKSCSGKTPTILAGSGYDASHEALYHQLGTEVLARGWNFATYEGPGQPTVRRQSNIGFQPDWWNAVTPVVDYLSTRPDVEMAKLALTGLSFGGTLAPRAASREHRFAAVVCIDGLYSLQETLLSVFPSQMRDPFRAGDKTAFDEITREIYNLSEAPTSLRWVIDQGLWAFDTASPFEWLTRLGEFNLDGVMGNITAPVFIGKGENDHAAEGQPEEAWKALGAEKGFYYEFKTELGAGEHCQLGAEAQLAMVTLDWLEGVFEGDWKSGNGTAMYN